MSGRRGSNPRPSAWKADALPTELRPLIVGGGGFEPPKAKPTDLQSAPFDRSGIPPRAVAKVNILFFLPKFYFLTISRADGRIRTADRLITNQLLWPTELHRQMSLKHRLGNISKSVCKCRLFFFNLQNIFHLF